MPRTLTSTDRRRRKRWVGKVRAAILWDEGSLPDPNDLSAADQENAYRGAWEHLRHCVMIEWCGTDSRSEERRKTLLIHPKARSWKQAFSATVAALQEDPDAAQFAWGWEAAWALATNLATVGKSIQGKKNRSLRQRKGRKRPTMSEAMGFYKGAHRGATFQRFMKTTAENLEALRIAGVVFSPDDATMHAGPGSRIYTIPQDQKKLRDLYNKAKERRPLPQN